MKAEFTAKLMEWNSSGNTRSLPWKGEKDPYKIWLSEVILQQTRVEQGRQYYERFINEFPGVQDLASAPEEKLFKLWEGLGYYSRCKNLHASAKIISEKFNGVFPDSYREILSLKGVGPYTAAAICSFAFNLPHAVVDGNVERVLSRYFGINTPVDSKDGKELYAELASSLLDRDSPALYNQAIMDFGATICKPRNPLCLECIQREDCQAYQHGWVNDLPVKGKLPARKWRWFTYYIVMYNEQVYIRKRVSKDIWANLFEFILHESSNESEQSFALKPESIKALLGVNHFIIQSVSPFFKQELTHQTISGQFVTVRIDEPLRKNEYILVPTNDLTKYPFPKLINAFLR
jgi:A/G-specific adenine glycosylase